MVSINGCHVALEELRWSARDGFIGEDQRMNDSGNSVLQKYLRMIRTLSFLFLVFHMNCCCESCSEMSFVEQKSPMQEAMNVS